MKASDPIRAARALTPIRSRARLFAVILLPIVMGGLSACTATKSAATFSAPRTIDASQAMIMPAPGGPSVISLIEERFADGVEQKVILGTDATNSGQNYLSIRLYGPMERETQGTSRLGYASVTAVAMTNEAIRAVPGVPMKASSLFLRNTYGPFGYAFGQTSGGDSCIFGWQQLRSSNNERQNFRNAGAIQIRLRLCENGASEKQLLTVMYSFTVTGSFASDQWNPFGKPKDVSSTLGAGGDPIYPEDSELAQPVTVATTPRAVRRRPVIVRNQSEDDQAVIERNIEDENAAKRIVDVPAPGADDSAANDGTVDTNRSTDNGITVPGPGCTDGNASCN
ncbi:cellulose biosynthesis protein BcsN [Rhizobium sp.]